MNNHFPIVLASLLCISACSDEIRLGLDIPESEDYSKVYIPQAASSPCLKSIFISDDVQTIGLSAFYGGPSMPGRDILVEFEPRPELVAEYNEFNGTDYTVLPEGSYSLSSSTATIKAGQQYSDKLNVNIETVGNIQVAKQYMLPVSIKSVSDSESVNDKLSTVYYVITGSYLPGQVPREKVLSFGQPMTNPIICVNKDLLVIDANHDLILYQLDGNGNYQKTRKIGEGWYFDIAFYMPPENRILARDMNTNITQFYFTEDYSFYGIGTIGFGWGIYNDLIPFKDISLIALGAADGALYNWTLKSSNWNYYNAFGQGWGAFINLFCFNNYLIAIEENGTMAAYSLSDATPPAVGPRRNIGTGWNQYKKLFQCGEDLLALDDNGDLWKYQFTPEGYWPLTAE